MAVGREHGLGLHERLLRLAVAPASAPAPAPAVSFQKQQINIPTNSSRIKPTAFYHFLNYRMILNYLLRLNALKPKLAHFVSYPNLNSSKGNLEYALTNYKTRASTIYWKKYIPMREALVIEPVRIFIHQISYSSFMRSQIRTRYLAQVQARRYLNTTKSIFKNWLHLITGGASYRIFGASRLCWIIIRGKA